MDLKISIWYQCISLSNTIFQSIRQRWSIYGWQRYPSKGENVWNTTSPSLVETLLRRGLKPSPDDTHSGMGSCNNTVNAVSYSHKTDSEAWYCILFHLDCKALSKGFHWNINGFPRSPYFSQNTPNNGSTFGTYMRQQYAVINGTEKVNMHVPWYQWLKVARS